jgi:hypothetical protein
VSVVTRTSSTVGHSGAEPPRHVEAEPALRDHRAQVSLERGQPLRAQAAGPLRAQILEDRRRPGERIDAARGVSPESLEAFLGHGYTARNALDVVLGIGTYTMSTLANRLTRAPLDEQLASSPGRSLRLDGAPVA